VESAGTKPSAVRPEAITVMKELGIDISGYRSKSVDEFAEEKFDYVLTVCDNAKESCPVFGKATRQHHSVNDPAAVEGSEETVLGAFREVRDELRASLRTIDGIVPIFVCARVMRVAFAYCFPQGLVLNSVRRSFISSAGMVTLAVG
jgi:arsenate reductase